MKILVVDDSLTMRRMVLRALAEAGFDVSEAGEAGDGFAALGMLASKPPDLVICDVNMPKLDGLKFVAALRTRIGSKCKVIMLTSKGSTETREAAMRAGANAFMTKPFESADLGKAIRDLLDAPQ